jgi:hypothetical protein
MNIAIIMSGIDQQTRTFTEPPERVREEIAALKADKSVSDAAKKEDLAQLEAALKGAKPIQYKETGPRACAGEGTRRHKPNAFFLSQAVVNARCGRPVILRLHLVTRGITYHVRKSSERGEMVATNQSLGP